MKTNLFALRQLDNQIAPLKEHRASLTLVQGWTRTIRKAIGLTVKQLAKRLHVHPSRVVKIESSETEGAVTLHTLQIVAEALHCHFVYGFIPKDDNLEALVKNRATCLAKEQLERTSHTMNLEAQTVNKKWLEEQINELSNELLRHAWKHLWEK